MEKLNIDKKYILSFLRSHPLCVVSTVDNNCDPHAAAVYFVVDDDFTLYFVSPSKTRKSTDLDINNRIVLTVTDEWKTETLRVRGLAHKDPSLLQDILSRLAVKLSKYTDTVTETLPLLKFVNQKKTVIVIKPYEITMRRFTKNALVEKRIAFVNKKFVNKK